MGQSSLQPAPAPVQPDHSVQFWSDSDSFLSGWATSISTAVEIGNAAVCVTTKIHTKALTRLFKQRGQDLTIAIEQGRYVPLDAAKCITAVMQSGRFDQNRFVEFFGSAIAKASHAIEQVGSRVTVFGEAVDLLRSRGKFDDVILWERSWSALAKAKANLVSARCSYAARAFNLQEENDHFQLICAEHSTVILPAGLPFSWSRGRRAHLKSGFKQIVKQAEQLVQGDSKQHYSDWQNSYRAALLETDRNTLFKQVETAEAAVLVRLQELPPKAGNLDERHQLMDAWSGLQMIKKWKLGFL
jgi:MEDS: MEthanogen/methylotroph, DcmR Sensory domain